MIKTHPSSNKLTRQEYKILSLSTLGATLELYDFVIFIFLLSELGTLFFPENTSPLLVQIQTFGILVAGFIVRPISGLIFAHFGDMLGRKKLFMLSIFLMTIPTLCIALLPTYATIGIFAPLLLLVMRLIQSAAIGGEVPGSWVFVAEHISKTRIGLGLGLICGGISGGSLLGSIVIFTLNKYFTPEQIHDFAWRIPFLIGGFLGLVAVYLRRYLSETPVFKEISTKRQLSQKIPIAVVIKKHKIALTLSGIMTWTTSTIVFAIILLPPTIFPEKYGITKLLMFQASVLTIIMMILGNISFGWLYDHFGIRLCYLCSWLGVLISTALFYSNITPTINAQEFIFYYMLAGYFAGTTVTMPIIAVPAFPPKVRYTGVSFSYNIVFTANAIITPALMMLFLHFSHFALVWYLALMSIISIIVGIKISHPS